MTPGNPDPTPPAGRTLSVAMGVLGLLALGLVAAAGVAMVKRLDLPSERPPLPESPDLSASPPPSSRTTNPPLPPARSPVQPTRPNIGFHPTAPDTSLVDEDPDRPGTIYDPEVQELVTIGVTLRRDGDTAGALQKLLKADELNPSHPRVLWELATVYKHLALQEKYEATLLELRDLGPSFGGEYYELAAHSLGGDQGGQNTPPGARLRPAFSFGDSLVTANPAQGDGERVTVRLAINSTLGEPIPPTDISVVMQFYDLVDGSGIDETRSDPPSRAWPTHPANWDDAGIEIVEYGYYMPVLTPEEIAAVGQRQYYGFVARVYYRDTLQDVLAVPRTLHALPSPSSNDPRFDPGGSMLDNSLFPE